MKEISVIIPSRNRKHYIEQLLIDLKAQTLLINEIIVVDQSHERYNLKDCKYFHINSLGPSKARNFGISKSTGDIIVFLDDDIRIEPNFIEELVTPILQQKTEVTCGAICDAKGNYQRDNIGVWHNGGRGNSWLKILTSNPDHPYTQFCSSFPAGCAAIKRDVLEKIGVFDAFFDPNGAGEDREMAIRLLKNGYSIFYNGKARIFHLAAKIGGRRELGNSGALLDVNVGYIIKKHFGIEEYKNYKNSIVNYNLRKLLIAFKTFSNVRTRISMHFFLNRKFKEIDRITTFG